MKQWPHWLRLAVTASPRHHIYAVASEVLFNLPIMTTNLARANGGAMWEELRQSLPVKLKQSEQGPEWASLASDTLWHYRRFLEGTRS